MRPHYPSEGKNSQPRLLMADHQHIRVTPLIMAPPHRRTKSSGPVPPSRTLVIDNGAYTIKAGFSSPSATSTASVIPNCMARDREKHVYVGSQLEKCKDFGDIVFRRPVEKGYIVNWEAEKEIWDHEFFEDKAPLHCDPRETGLILTEAPNALPQLQTNCDQIVFEEFGFASYLRCPGMLLVHLQCLEITLIVFVKVRC
jgi:actin-related protein 6